MANSTGSSVDQIWKTYLQYQSYEEAIKSIENPTVQNQTLKQYTKAFSDRIDFILKNNPPTPEEFNELFSRIKDKRVLEKILHKIKFGVKEREQEVKQVLTSLKENLETKNAIRETSDWKTIYWEELCIKFPWEDYKFNCFISNEESGNYLLGHFPEFKDRLRSKEEMVELFKHIKKYMEDNGVEVDLDIDYKKILEPGQKGYLDWFEALKYFKQIVNLEDNISFHIRDEETGLLCVNVGWKSYSISDGSHHVFKLTLWDFRLCMK